MLVRVLPFFLSLPVALVLSLRPVPLLAVRVVSTSPQVTEVLFQLGKGKDIVGTTSFSDYPEAAKQVPSIGPLTSPGVEAVVALRPDWVVVDPTYGIQNFARAIENQSIRACAWKVRSVNDLFEVSKSLLSKIYSEDQNPTLSRWRSYVDDLRSRKFPQRTAVIFVWDNPAVIADRSAFLSDLLSLIGVENLMSVGKTDFLAVSPEWLMNHRPEIVFFLGFGMEPPAGLKQNVSRIWPSDTPRVIFLPSDQFARASFTSFEGLKEIEKRIGEKSR